jgi:hypothetical protein
MRFFTAFRMTPFGLFITMTRTCIIMTTINKRQDYLSLLSLMNNIIRAIIIRMNITGTIKVIYPASKGINVKCIYYPKHEKN